MSAGHRVIDLNVVADLPAQHGIGVLAPFDFALDRELWRWLPPEVSLHSTRLPYRPVPVTVEMALGLAEPAAVRAATRDVLAPGPAVVVHACTSASFVSGAAGERALRAEMTAAGAPAAVTTSGALVAALAELDARRVAVLTPYVDSVTGRLHGFLAEHGITVTTSLGLGLSDRIWRLSYADVLAAAARIDLTGADALFVSCTNVPTYDIIAPLQRLLGVPVLTANQVTMWAALRAAGLDANGPGQHLMESSAVPGAVAA